MTGQVEAAFRAEIESAGLRPNEVIPDGKIHRCPVDGKPSARDGAYVLYGDDTPAGWWLNWRTGQEDIWRANRERPLNEQERQSLARQMESARREREAEQAREQAQAANRARAMLGKAKPCISQPYLERKGVKPCPRLKVDAENRLLVPVLGPDGKPQSLQTITPNGEKRFLAGGRMAGGYFPIRGDSEGPLLVCEGLATGLSLHEATGHTVLCAFTAGNLEAVASMAREKYPERPITICGDDDRETGENPGRTKATEAAKVIGGKLAIPVFPGNQAGTDFNDLHQAEGLEAVKAQVKESRAPTLEAFDWPEPIPFDDFQPAPLPVEVFPSWAQDFILAASEHLQVAPCLLVANVLGAVATAISRKLAVEVKPGYREPLNLYILAPAPPAERKTAAQGIVFKPMFEWEAERALAMREEIAQAQSKRKSQEAIISGLRSKLAKAKPEERLGLMEEIAGLESDLIEVPHPPRLLADDITPEATASLMAAHQERLGIASCEGGLFDTLAGRYSNGVANLDLVLKAHAGEPVRVDRKGGPPVMMESPALTLCLSPQPEVLTGLVGKPGFRGRGLLGRFAYILPISRLGRRLVKTPPIPPATERAFIANLMRLLDLPWAQDENGEPCPSVVKLEPVALENWMEFASAIEPELGENGRFEMVRDWAGKLYGLAARLAGNLHAMEHLKQAPVLPISTNTMGKALELAAGLIGHALAAFGMMGADPEIEAARHALGWIKREGLERFTLRDCHRGIMGRCKKAEQVKAALLVLEDRGYILPDQPPKSAGPGRPSSPEYIVNPKALEVY